MERSERKGGREEELACGGTKAAVPRNKNGTL